MPTDTLVLDKYQLAFDMVSFSKFSSKCSATFWKTKGTSSEALRTNEARLAYLVYFGQGNIRLESYSTSSILSLMSLTSSL